MADPVVVSTNESILATIKKLLGPEDTDTSFDTDIIIYVNSALFALTQLGVGPIGGYSISSRDNKWSEFLGDITNLEIIKTYIYLKVKLVFDPPQYQTVTDALLRIIAEYEWRIIAQIEIINLPEPTPIIV